MNLDGKAMHVIATCISRGERLAMETDPAIAKGLWCKECRTHSAMQIPLRGISPQGVYDLGIMTSCAICDGSNE